MFRNTIERSFDILENRRDSFVGDQRRIAFNLFNTFYYL